MLLKEDSRIRESFFACLHIVVREGREAQSVVMQETRNTVLGVLPKKPLNFKDSAPFGLSKIRKKSLKNLLHSICSMYIIQKLVKREEAGSYRASG